MTVNRDYGARWHTSHHKRHNVGGSETFKQRYNNVGEKADSGFFGMGGGGEGYCFGIHALGRYEIL